MVIALRNVNYLCHWLAPCKLYTVKLVFRGKSGKIVREKFPAGNLNIALKYQEKSGNLKIHENIKEFIFQNY